MCTVHQSPFFVIFLFLHLQQLQLQDAVHSRPHAGGLAMGSSIHSRPRPSQDITSLIHIQEIPGSKYDPRSINNAKLKLKLGRHFDPEFMSIYPPEDLNTTTTVQPQPKKPNLKKLRQKQKGSKYTHDNDVVLGTMLDYGAVAEKFHGRLRFKFIRKLEKFLQVYTSCPLQYRWRDLGVRFWPRYLREGHCQGQQYNDAPSNANANGRSTAADSSSSSSSPAPRSCSIPPGLYCQPSAQVYKVLLRWHCQNWEHRKRCRWLEIRHPVITACSCGTCAMTAS